MLFHEMYRIPIQLPYVYINVPDYTASHGDHLSILTSNMHIHVDRMYYSNFI